MEYLWKIRHKINIEKYLDPRKYSEKTELKSYSKNSKNSYNLTNIKI